MSKFLVTALILFASHAVFAGDVPESDIPPVDNPQVEKIPVSTLTPEDHEVLARGLITDKEAVYGEVSGTIIGFGTGHMFQKRYMNTGLILTLGEASATALIAFGFSSCSEGGFNNQNPGTKRCSIGAGVVGIAGLLGLKTWEIIDVWTAQNTQNTQYRFLKAHMVDDRKSSNTPSLSLIPAVDQASNSIDGAGAALQIKF